VRLSVLRPLRVPRNFGLLVQQHKSKATLAAQAEVLLIQPSGKKSGLFVDLWLLWFRELPERRPLARSLVSVYESDSLS